VLSGGTFVQVRQGKKRPEAIVTADEPVFEDSDEQACRQGLAVSNCFVSTWSLLHALVRLPLDGDNVLKSMPESITLREKRSIQAARVLLSFFRN
jgi:hypothetical protein